jgi:trimethylamine:corrinoid methyltransferase-like protein
MREKSSSVEVLSPGEVAVIHVAEPHIVESMRKNYFPSRLFSREDWENCQRKGAPDLLARAHETVESLAQGHEKRNPVPHSTSR